MLTDYPYMPSGPDGELKIPPIERAVLAERERCAKIAEHYDTQYADKGYCDNFCGTDIAQQIREGD